MSKDTDCKLTIWATCVPLEHCHHRCVDMASRMEGFQSDLEEVLSQTDHCIKAVQKAIQATKQQATKAKHDVDTLKEQTSASYQAILQHVKQLEQKHMKEIDLAYQQVEKVMAETLDRQETMEVTMKSIHVYGEQLKKQGTAYDLNTNLMSLTNRSRAEADKPPPEIKWVMDIEWKEWEGRVDMRPVRLMKHEGEIKCVGKDRRLTTFTTRCQNYVRGIVLYHNHLIIVHYVHDQVYIYDDKGGLKSSVKVRGMANPWGMCLVKGARSTHHLLITDGEGDCLWWMTIEQQGTGGKLGQPQQHKVEYRPWGAATDSTGQALVCDSDNRRLYLYSKPGEKGTCIQLPDDITPRQAVSDPAGGYVVSDDKYRLVWVDGNGQVTRHYTDTPGISAEHMTYDGTNLFIAGSYGASVPIVNGEGMYAGCLLGKEEDIRHSYRVCVDPAHHHVWLAYTGQDGNERVTMADYCSSPSPVTTLILCGSIPKIHT